jgi:hypothetical protein
MNEFTARMGLRDALELYLFLSRKEMELDAAASAGRFYASLRGYLYDHLSIEEMESPEALLKRL